MGGVETRTDLAADVTRVIGRFRRHLRRSAGTGYAAGRLSESHAELLRLVTYRPGLSVSAAAHELGLQPNTASTMVSRLVSEGLLERHNDAIDRRVGRLRLTESAQHVMDASAAARRAVVSELLEQLDEGQLGVLAKGLEVLEEMTRMLQERST
ncbi:MarR family winged helix-turn-helix transcriptional regulator [Mycobacterium sp. 1423905.2]|uniref:MarR family winged helix-turn-helix transcriptional regulator n=1 Tax=Mycobacterium sp. 1423905.2 TaxID=1856859 RepID=UPI0007FE420B|nr:MarR family transcriptional regulator [Mycobacterium sp. 1423905.2]OBJ56427.1 MarR family transcriptional regulator [Mycobacterium sp. 1423905.2]